MRLSVLTVPNCPSCEVLKAALAQVAPAQFEVLTLNIDEVRHLRREGSRLTFPILQVLDLDEQVLARRQGIDSSSVEAERDKLKSWFSSVGYSCAG